MHKTEPRKHTKSFKFGAKCGQSLLAIGTATAFGGVAGEQTVWLFL